MININELIERIKETVRNHRLSCGEYAQWPGKASTPYGCADASNILYTVGDFISDPMERLEHIKAIRAFQNAETGLFEENTHHPMHTTAHCIAALELYDVLPEYPLKALMKYTEKDELYSLLDNLNWNNPWPESHKGAGIYASFVITNNASDLWKKWYFDWFDNEADPMTGMWRKGYVKPAGENAAAQIFEYMAGSFHYLFNYEHAKMPLKYPEKMVESCLDLFIMRESIFKRLGNEVGFLEIDWVYCLNRASRQTGYYFKECKKTLMQFAEHYISYLYSIDYKTDEKFNDLHLLFGAVCALAELQQALPGEIYSSKPLKLALDRRPFI